MCDSIVVKDIHTLGFNEFPENVERTLDTFEFQEAETEIADKFDNLERLDRLRMGTVLTLAQEIRRGGGSYRFLVDSTSDGEKVILRYPGMLNNGFDYRARIEGWTDSGAPRPSHADIYSEFYHKREDSLDAFYSLCNAAEEILQGKSGQDAFDKYKSDFDFTVGRTAESILLVLPWLFIEQDIRYWYGDGRERTIGAIRGLRDGKPISKYVDDDDFERTEDIHQTPLAIPNRS